MRIDGPPDLVVNAHGRLGVNVTSTVIEHNPVAELVEYDGPYVARRAAWVRTRPHAASLRQVRGPGKISIKPGPRPNQPIV